MIRRWLLASLLTVGLAAAPFESTWVSAEQERTNAAAWQAMDESGRESLRRVWNRLEGLSETRRLALMRRMATLARLEETLSRRAGRPAEAEELRQSLAGLSARLPAALAQQGVEVDPQQPLADQVRRHTRARIEAFLDGLVAAGRLAAEARPRLSEPLTSEPRDAGALAWAEFVRESLELRKQEELYLAERGAAASTGELRALEPLDVVVRVRQQRRARGYLGWAARSLGLLDEERRELEALPDEDLLLRLRRIMQPRILQVLREQGVEEALQARVLAAPFREQERFLDRLLSGS